MLSLHVFFFFFNDTATTEIYPLSLHDALPICMVFAGQDIAGWATDRIARAGVAIVPEGRQCFPNLTVREHLTADRKSTRLNSSHLGISYAVFCLKKKRKYDITKGLSTARRSQP